MTCPEVIAIEYLKRFGFEVRKIPRETKKTPDFEVLRDGRLVMRAECKHRPDPPEGPDDDIADPTYNWLTNCIYSAHKQLDSEDRAHTLPRALIIVNEDPAADHEDLRIVLQGFAVTDNGQPLYAFSKFALDRIRDIKHSIDLYVWMQVCSGYNRLLLTAEGKFEKQLEALLTPVCGPIRS